MGLVWGALWKPFPELYGFRAACHLTREGTVQPRDRSWGELGVIYLGVIWIEIIGDSLLPY